MFYRMVKELQRRADNTCHYLRGHLPVSFVMNDGSFASEWAVSIFYGSKSLVIDTADGRVVELDVSNIASLLITAR